MLSSVFVVAAVIMIILAVVEAGYLYRGLHRGAYVEKPEWKPEPQYFIWNGTLHFPESHPQDEASVVLTISPPGGIGTLPAILPMNEDHGRFGRFGDLDIDWADSEPLRVHESTWFPDGK